MKLHQLSTAVVAYFKTYDSGESMNAVEADDDVGVAGISEFTGAGDNNEWKMLTTTKRDIDRNNCLAETRIGVHSNRF